MSAFGQGNNEEYLVHIITIKHLLEQKGTIQDVRKAFKVVVEVRKEIEPLLEAQEGKTDSRRMSKGKSSPRSRNNSRLCASL